VCTFRVKVGAAPTLAGEIGPENVDDKWSANKELLSWHAIASQRRPAKS